MSRNHLRRLLGAAVGAGALAALVVAASADTVGPITFEAPTYTPGTIHNQDGWQSAGAAGSGCAMYDHKVVTNSGAPPSFGGQSLRISNAVTSGCFGDQTFSKPTINEAGEPTASNNGLSGGVRQNHFEAQWQFASTVPSAEQPGLSVVASPDRGDGSRMSWVQMADTPAGLQVNFFDVQGTTNPANFVGPTPIAVGLSRTVPHTIKVTIDFVSGPSNDVVKVYVDSALVHTGTTWENYYRFDSEAQPEGGPRTVDSILFRTGGTAAPANAGKGFLIDNLTILSGSVPQTKDDCKGGQWQTYTIPRTFNNQGDCLQFVNTGK